MFSLCALLLVNFSANENISLFNLKVQLIVNN